MANYRKRIFSVVQISNLLYHRILFCKASVRAAGLGKFVALLTNVHAIVKAHQVCRRFSLSLRERAGVRGYVPAVGIVTVGGERRPWILKFGAFLELGCWCLVLLLSACVGPNYRRPPVNVPDTFRGVSTNSAAASLGELPWWDLYRDETLTDLIRAALTNNYDLRIAARRVEQARFNVWQARSELLPQVNYEGEAARGKNTALGVVTTSGKGTVGNGYFAALTASWEVDLWGRIRRLNESARAQFLAADEARRAVYISLISQVAQAYFELLELDHELEIAERTTNSFGESLRIFSQRLEGGAASRLETSRAEAALATTAAVMPDLERRITIKENQINTLLGRNPGPIPRTAPTQEKILSLEVPAGLPSRLLERRPDIREAEQSVRSANAQVGVAIGDFLPRIGLSSLYGGVNSDVGSILSSSSGAWSVAANITGPVFQGGKLYAQYKQQLAAWEIAKLEYEQTALNAFREVSDALISRQRLEEARLEQSRAVAAYQQAVAVSTQRYTAGKASYYEVLEAQQQLFPAENSLSQTELNLRLSVVTLYRALGGGWEMPDSRSSESARAASH
jgi:multidrug efflux system outer membrane protein